MSDRDWKSDPITGDLVFADGDIIMVSDDNGPDSIRQDVEERLRLVLGEWFLSDPASTNPDDGLDLFGLLGKPARPAVIASAVRRSILATPGIVDVLSLDVSISASTRTASVTWSASTDAGLIAPTTITLGG